MARSGIDRLFDWLDQEPQWTTPYVTRKLVKMEVTDELSIVPDTPNGPMLQIVIKDTDGDVVFKQRYNLAAVDELIGKLIKMRDHMAQMKGDDK